jgi:DHA1 family bicyclomycin/chloramphenicol resistance-like MFS transporter
MYLPAFPQLTRDFHASASSVQLTLTACLVGLVVGQLTAGALSDALGRRTPLIVGLAAYVGASLLCALAPSIAALVALRFVQGATGAAGIVTSRAVVRDLYSGADAARFFSLLMLVNGLAPALAPTVGGQVLRVTSWRGVFVVLACMGAVLLVAVVLGLRETLPPERRHEGGLPQTGRVLLALVRNRIFVGYALGLGLSLGGMFAYIAGSPFVLQDIHGLSPQLFAVAFGANAAGIIVCSQANGLLVRRYGPRRLLRIALVVGSTGAVSLLAVILAGVGLVGILPTLFVFASSMGFIIPNATALALADHPHVAGSASALLGVTQYAVGAAAAPLVGIAGTRSAVPMGAVIAVLAVTALTACTVLTRKPARARAA